MEELRRVAAERAHGHAALQELVGALGQSSPSHRTRHTDMLGGARSAFAAVARRSNFIIMAARLFFRCGRLAFCKTLGMLASQKHARRPSTVQAHKISQNKETLEPLRNSSTRIAATTRRNHKERATPHARRAPPSDAATTPELSEGKTAPPARGGRRHERSRADYR